MPEKPDDIELSDLLHELMTVTIQMVQAYQDGNTAYGNELNNKMISLKTKINQLYGKAGQ